MAMAMAMAMTFITATGFDKMDFVFIAHRSYSHEDINTETSTSIRCGHGTALRYAYLQS
jgi:hypothetical protein